MKDNGLGFGGAVKKGVCLLNTFSLSLSLAVQLCGHRRARVESRGVSFPLSLSLSTMVKTLRASRNKEVVRGVGRYGRSKMYHKRGLWAIKDKNGGSFPSHEKVAAVEVAAVRAPKFYPADDVKKPLHKNKVINAPKLRSSISPGTILILLAGHFKGKRVVFLKQLESGLLLVTGPFKVNGVPLKRVNQAYVIATSTKVDIAVLDVAKYSDGYFKREVTKKKKGESQFFEAEKEEEKSLPQEKIDDQKAIDAKLMPLIEAVPELKSYLSARFSLKSGVKPHELVF